MLAVVGTAPDLSLDLTVGRVKLEGGNIVINGRSIPVNRGTPALIGAAIQTLTVFGKTGIAGFLAGDIGLGQGSRKIYHHLVHESLLPDIQTLVFHYLQPDVDWHNRVLFRIDDMENRPVLIADAGFMYAAKMSGQAGSYDLFTPDAGELAFLADETAPHPFYTRGFILHTDNKVPDLVQRAYDHGNAARYLLVKGSRDYIMDGTGLLSSVDSPSTEAMEAIGGTGDTLTGIVTALIHTGMTIPESAHAAARINRLAGFNAQPTPATQILDIIAQIPKAVETVLKDGN
ncbi:MAG: sugar kinase [Desulfobacterales bacterium RIFOXYA12_FULL_46_15]|nr:MAG: sugar kinase [Desulfobacterales bacterium RIFOXYA12_FULL_46_15]